MHMNELVLRPPYTGWGGSEANRPAKAAELPSGGCRAHALGRQPTITPLGQRSRVAGLPRLSTATQEEYVTLTILIPSSPSEPSCPSTETTTGWVGG